MNLKHSSLKPITYVRHHFARVEESRLPSGVQVVCGYHVPHVNASSDPRLVTCDRCRKWLAKNVQYHNYAWNETKEKKESVK